MSAAAVVAVLLLAGAVAGRPRHRGRDLASPPRWIEPLPSPPAHPDHPTRPVRRVGRRTARRDDEAEVLRGLPELLDLLAVAAAAGLPAASAVAAVGPRAPAPWRPAFADVELALERGARLVEAVERLVAHHGDLARPLVAVLRAALDDGDSLGPALARLAVDARDLRRRRAEEAARRLPVRLLLPLVACSLPAFAVLTVVPILAGALSGIRLPD